MKKFILKFLIAVALFFIPASIYQFYIIPNASSDSGRLGMIPFGKEQEGLDVDWYQRDEYPLANVVDIQNPDSIFLFKTITIGDSFSQFNKNGYQLSLSGCMRQSIANFQCSYTNYDVFETYLILLNNGYLTKGQNVIVESVERSFVGRVSQLDSLDGYRYLSDLIEPSNYSEDDSKIPFLKSFHSKDDSKIPFLNSFFSWIRLSVGYKNPIQRFTLTKDCFTHNRYSSTLYVYNSSSIGDGDILWRNNSEEDYKKMSENLETLIEMSEAKGVNLVIMIACDKYDAYEPWIEELHEENPTLNKIPQNNRIYISRPCLRKAISNGIKDVYKVNNTHWSVVGADIVGRNLYEFMKQSSSLDL